jgi:pyruvate,water dikinase
LHFLALGYSLKAKGVIDCAEDIFYLYQEEITGLISEDLNGSEFKALVSRRKEEMQQTADLVLPEIIYGEAPPLESSSPRQVMRGIPASQGYYKGYVRVVRSLRDFPRLNQGEVLVVPFSDVGWTPLFAKAGAVIAASGGILSHSSIVAREYNIPAVVSVNGALQLEDGTVVVVDGYTGEIKLHDNETLSEETS